MTAPAVPNNAEDLEAALSEPTTLKNLSNPKALAEWIDKYAEASNKRSPDVQREVAAETQKALAEVLNGSELAKDVKRLNQDLLNRADNHTAPNQHGKAYNPKAVGAMLDNEFADATDFIRTTWHRNTTPEAVSKVQRLRNAFGSVVPSDGGFLVPETLRAQLLQIALSMGLVRQRATVVPMETARVPFPAIDVTSNASSVFGGMIGYWGEESAALTDSSAKFNKIVLDAQKLTGLSVVPNELLADSLMSFSAIIEQLWPQAIAWFEDNAFTVGTGVGEPLGYLGNPATVAVAKETGQSAATIVVENIVKMYSRMLPSSISRAAWICSPDSLPELFTMALSVGTGGGPVMVSNAADPAPMTIFGRPLIVSEKAKTVGTQGDIAFVDLSYYLIGDRQQMSLSSSTDWKFGNDQTAFRIIQRVDGRPWIQSAITPQNGSSSTLSPFVELAVRA